MKNYVLEVSQGQKKTAGAKAKEDIVNILTTDDYEKLTIEFPENKIFRQIFGKLYVANALKNVVSGDTIIYQYPAYSRIIGDYFIQYAHKKNIKTKIVIHDADSLRLYKNSPNDIKRELDFFNLFDTVIAHNNKMKKWLEKNGVKTKIVTLDIFDYLHPSQIKNNVNKNLPIVFAGNLGKSKFLEQISIEKKLDLFGIDPSENYSTNITYNGSFDPDDLGNHLNASFGLVWDGESISTCTGIVGEYMKYNNPHKTSLYLSLGIPVIIWEEAAMADFITKNNLGFSVKNISEIDSKIAELNDKEYSDMISSIEAVKLKLNSGFYIKEALKK